MGRALRTFRYYCYHLCFEEDGTPAEAERVRMAEKRNFVKLNSDQLQSFTFEISVFSAELRTPIFTSAMPHCSTSLYYHQLHGVTFKCSDFSAELRTLIFTCAVPHCSTSLYYYQFHGVIFETFVLSAELRTFIFTSAMPQCSVWMQAT